MDLEQLAKIKVVTATKRAQPMWTTPVAVSVITDEELRLSGANSLPQALRLAPGVDVAQINAQRYSVAIRGFAGEYSNKLLVLQDGRSLYNPQFLGVFWDAQDVNLDDVQQIEVVRGPGGTAWGINAMNGVINIRTKDARDTLGAFVNAGVGTFERAFTTVRYGGMVNSTTDYRVYAKAFSRGETELANGAGAGDDWSQLRTGFRVDAQWSGANHFTLQGDGYSGKLLQYTNRVANEFESSGANLLARLTAQLPGDSSLQVLSYLDRVRRRAAPATTNADTFALEATHQIKVHPRHTVNWSANFQHVRNEALGRIGHNYDPAVRRLQQVGLTLADDFVLEPERLVLSAGVKAERNDFTGWEYLPSARLTWTPSTRKTGWLAISRGLQTPDLSSYDLTIDVPGAVRVRSLPNRNRPAGEIVATEAGWRVTPSPTLSIDASVFLNRYDALPSSVSTFDARSSTLTVIPMNDQFGQTHGGELAALWEPVRQWRVRASYSLLRMHLHVRAGSNDALAALREEQRNPREQWQVMATGHMGRDWDFTGWIRYVGRQPAVAVPAHVGLDLRLAHRLTRETEIAVAGKNLLDARHPEFSRSPGFPSNSEIPRSVQIEFSWGR